MKLLVSNSLAFFSLFLALSFVSCNKKVEVEPYPETQKLKDDQIIQAYLAENNITDYEKRPSGLYHVPITTSDLPKPVENDSVAIHYTGWLLYGKIFDSSYYSQDASPFLIKQGRTGVIEGWKEGIPLIPKGGKSLLIIPAHLAYGANGSGALIPPYSILAFEIEIIDIY